MEDDTCRFIVFDFDNHEKGAEKNDFANADNLWRDEVDSLRRICDINGIDALVECSRSGRGAHLWIFFQKPIEAGLAREFGNTLLIKGAESVNLKSFRFYDRMLPMQDHLPEGGVGNLIALPLQGQALKKGNSAFVDEHWNVYPNQWEVLLNKKKLSKEFAASDTIVDILQEANAKYVYGVTATPFRGDGLEKITYMLLGAIRYQYTSRDRANEQGIEHIVYPRFTRAVAPRFSQDKMHPNEAYEIIRNNEDRDELIIRDVKKCVDDGRTPVVLSKYVEHSQRLYQRLINYADKVFLLSGSNSKKEHKEILKQMNQVAPEESMILVATGKLIGEGFDYPRLDTLIMATPVAWKGVVEQYAGRLNRDYDGKKSVIIYDYVDSHISMFDRMYHKRLYRRSSGLVRKYELFGEGRCRR